MKVRQTGSGDRSTGRVPLPAVVAFVALALPGAMPSSGQSTPDGLVPDGQHRQPARIISLDYCADQYVLGLADRAHILALSPDATASFSYLRDQARGLPMVRPVAEDAIILQPDLVVRSYGGGSHARQLLERAGLPVLDVPFINDLEGIKRSITLIADRLGVPARGQALIEEMERRLGKLRPARQQRTVLYTTPAGVTTGPGSLLHQMLELAGWINFQQQPGWHPLPLERLVYQRPDAVAVAFFDSDIKHLDPWSPGRHPVARKLLEGLPTIVLQDAWTSCAAWFALDAIEALARALNALPNRAEDP